MSRTKLGLSVVALSLVGCVGPMKLTRRLDEKTNQLYVDAPVITQVSSPLILAGGVVAVTVDVLLVNPVFWWKDALRGHGTAYFYKNPEVPAEQ
ncbi:MAG: hypothetical protein KDC38_16545 [Planctomycetes bacterium]|nr:hypothetical protein [Planctomycetota bacterium]